MHVYIIVSDSFLLYIFSIHYRCYYLMLSFLFVYVCMYTYTTDVLREFLDVVLRKVCVTP